VTFEEEPEVRAILIENICNRVDFLIILILSLRKDCFDIFVSNRYTMNVRFLLLAPITIPINLIELHDNLPLTITFPY
jgi:hypothetical protein